MSLSWEQAACWRRGSPWPQRCKAVWNNWNAAGHLWPWAVSSIYQCAHLSTTLKRLLNNDLGDNNSLSVLDPFCQHINKLKFLPFAPDCKSAHIPHTTSILHTGSCCSSMQDWGRPRVSWPVGRLAWCHKGDILDEPITTSIQSSTIILALGVLSLYYT